MVVTDYNEQFLDKRGTDHLIDELKAYIDNLPSGGVDLSNYVTKSELQAKLDALDINIDLSSYATKEELTNAINSIDLSAYAKKTDIPSLNGYVTETELNAKGYLTQHQDLSAYALKTEIPSLDGLATTEYVDNAIANVPSGGNVDLSNYYTKAETNALIPSLEGYATEEYVSTAINSIPATDLSNYYTKNETYSKTEVDIKVIEAGGGSSVPILPMKDWIELNTQYNENVDFKNKKIYFDTSIAFKNLLKDKTYRFYLYNEDGESMTHHNYVIYENGILKFIHSNLTKVDLDGQSATSVSLKTSYLYDKTQSNGEWRDGTLYGKWINGWKSLSEDFIENTEVNNVCLCGNVFRLGNGISSPNFGYKDNDVESDAYDIDGKELYHALLKSIIKIVDENGNEIAFKTVPTQEDYLEYVNNLSGGGGTVDLSNYYTKSETYSKTEVDTLVANSGGGSSSGSGEVYSTEETAIGTWIDGKTIYRKVFEMTIRSDIQNGTPAITSIEHGIENFNQLVDLRCINKSSSMKTSIGAYGLFPVNLTNLSSWNNIKNYSIRPTVTNTKIMIDAGIQWKGTVITVIVEYTKTV